MTVELKSPKSTSRPSYEEVSWHRCPLHRTIYDVDLIGVPYCTTCYISALPLFPVKDSDTAANVRMPGSEPLLPIPMTLPIPIA